MKKDLTLVKKVVAMSKNPNAFIMEYIQQLETKMIDLKKSVENYEKMHENMQSEMTEMMSMAKEMKVRGDGDFEMANTMAKNILKDIKGQDGEDADPVDVAQELLSMPEFIELTKARDGEPGHTPTETELVALIKPLIPSPIPGKDSNPREVARIMYESPTFLKMIKGDKGDKPTKEELMDLIKLLMPKIKEVNLDEMISKINTKEEVIEQKVIKGLVDDLKNIRKSIREKRKGGGGGGSAGNWVHEVFATTAATTSVTLTSNVAGNSKKIILRYQGQVLAWGQQYTISGKTISFTFTLQDDTFVEVSYERT